MCYWSRNNRCCKTSLTPMLWWSSFSMLGRTPSKTVLVPIAVLFSLPVAASISNLDCDFSPCKFTGITKHSIHLTPVHFHIHSCWPVSWNWEGSSCCVCLGCWVRFEANTHCCQWQQQSTNSFHPIPWTGGTCMEHFYPNPQLSYPTHNAEMNCPVHSL